jgi:hypothetical protein
VSGVRLVSLTGVTVSVSEHQVPALLRAGFKHKSEGKPKHERKPRAKAPESDDD